MEDCIECVLEEVLKLPRLSFEPVYSDAAES